MSHSNIKKVQAILAYVAAAFSGALGQFCFKIFSSKLGEAPGLELILSPWLWVAMLSYFSVMILFIIGLRLWGEMSTLYPVYGTTFVWAALMAVLWLGESISPTGIAGISLVVVGIGLLNAGK